MQIKLLTRLKNADTKNNSLKMKNKSLNKELKILKLEMDKIEKKLKAL